MENKYIVRLTDEECNVLKSVLKKLKGSSQKVRRAQVLLAADADGSNWTDQKIADEYSCRTKNRGERFFLSIKSGGSHPLKKGWRRKGDSNSRDIAAHTISNRAPSTTQPFLRNRVDGTGCAPSAKEQRR